MLGGSRCGAAEDENTTKRKLLKCRFVGCHVALFQSGSKNDKRTEDGKMDFNWSSGQFEIKKL